MNINGAQSRHRYILPMTFLNVKIKAEENLDALRRYIDVVNVYNARLFESNFTCASLNSRDNVSGEKSIFVQGQERSTRNN